MRVGRLAAIAFTLVGCGGDGGTPNGPADADSGTNDSAVSCASADMSAAPKELHAAAAQVLTLGSPCGLSTCHDGDRPESNLTLLGVTNLREALVDKPSCQAPSFSLIDGSGGDGALANSWLWQKLVAPADASGVLSSQADFGASASCGQQPDQPFGTRMPRGALTLSDQRLVAIRNWICAGAPAP